MVLFELIYFPVFTNKKLFLRLQCRLNTNHFFDSVKLIEYLAFAVIVVSFNPCVRPSPRTKIFITFLLLSYTEELLSTQKIMTFLPQLPSVNEKCERASNPIP